MRTIIGVGVGSVLTLSALVAGQAHAVNDHPDHKHGRDIPAWVIRPCKTESSVNCRWNAHTQGNHKGHTYVVREFPGSAHMVCVMYTVTKFAKHNDYCIKNK